MFTIETQNKRNYNVNFFLLFKLLHIFVKRNKFEENKCGFIHEKLSLFLIGKFFFGVTHCIHTGDSICRAIFYIRLRITFSNSCRLHLSCT